MYNICSTSILYIVAGEDFVGSPVQAVFPMTAELGDLACVQIPIIDDNILECSQEFTVDIVDATLGTAFVGLQSSATVSITDNDGRLTKLMNDSMHHLTFLCIKYCNNLSVIW